MALSQVKRLVCNEEKTNRADEKNSIEGSLWSCQTLLEQLTSINEEFDTVLFKINCQFNFFIQSSVFKLKHDFCFDYFKLNNSIS
jgi:hypothetical protein